MHRILHFVFYVSFTSLFGCAASNTTSNTEFNDDLTQYRVKVNSSINQNLTESNMNQETDWGNLAFEASVTEDIDVLVAQMAKTNLRVESFPGYRIQVYSAGNRNDAEEVIKYLEEELEVTEPIYLDYEQPNFKVKIGDYTNRVKAHEIHSTLKEEYPYSIVIRDEIAFDMEEYLNPTEKKKMDEDSEEEKEKEEKKE